MLNFAPKLRARFARLWCKTISKFVIDVSSIYIHLIVAPLFTPIIFRMAEQQASAKVVAPTSNTMFNYFTKLPSKTCIVEENPRKSAPVFNKQHVEEFQNSLKSGQHKPYSVERNHRGSLRARLLQFCEDVRPPYFGTWQKTSSLITGRRPFFQDSEIFDYEVDSEAEWDLGGPGESLKGDDSEDEEELDDYEIDMKTFVPHGYVSDDELNSDNEETPSADRSIDNCDAEDDSNSDVKIISEIKIRPNRDQQQPPPPKQTPKYMDMKPIALGLNFDGCPTISESKVQFLRSFQGVSCSSEYNSKIKNKAPAE